MKKYDFAIAGAGPAGLAAAIKAAELGHKVVVLEKGPIAGPEPRGESMPPHDLINNLMGSDFLSNISNFVSNSRRFHSAGDKKMFL
ncbi:MAG: FAD-binding protein [Spirochaetales bacterium]|nr:FAD-binding protein [Spirochaetales bacterium]